MTRHDELVERFACGGAVVVRAALDRDAVDLATEGIEAAVAERGERAIVASQDDDPGLFVEDFRCAERVPALARLSRARSLAALAARLMVSDSVRFHHDHVLVKRAGTRQPTPWHQDQPYYDIDGRQTVSFWIPVDPVPEAATLEVALGSHRGPWYLPRTFLDERARWFPEGSLAEIPDMDADPPPFPTRRWALEPGDLIAFRMATLHRAGPAPRERDRRVVSLRYVGDDVVHAPRAWTTSPDFGDVAEELTAGESLDHPLFPLVWP